MVDSALSWGPDDVATYLYYGYLPQAPDSLVGLPGWSLTQDSVGERADHDDLIQRGRAAFESAFEELPEGPHVVPLSGGLDSRAILGELCRRVPPSEITTVTVGSAGSLDLELAAIVASVAGVQHVAIDLGHYQLRVEALAATASKNDGPTWLLGATYNRLMRERCGDDALYWSGYLGSRLSSTKHLADDPQIGFESARERFVAMNPWSRSTPLHPPDADLQSRLPVAPLSADSPLGHDEQFDLWIRQERLTRPVNVPTGFRCRTPFTHEPLSTFLLSLPRADGSRPRVYRELLLRSYPTLFALPTTAKAGLALEPSRISRFVWNLQRVRRATQRRIARNRPDVWQTNYLDLAHALRHRSDYREVAHDRLKNLAEREATPWLDIEGIWNQHQDRLANHAMALTLLVSLDIHLDVARGGT